MAIKTEKTIKIDIKQKEFGFLNDINKTLDGNIICLTGENGAGKTVILKKLQYDNKINSIFSSTAKDDIVRPINRSFYRSPRERFTIEEFFIEMYYASFKFRPHSMYDIENTLFSTNNIRYTDRIKLIENISNELPEQDKNQFLKDMGLLTIEDAKTVIHNTLKYLFKKLTGRSQAKQSADPTQYNLVNLEKVDLLKCNKTFELDLNLTEFMKYCCEYIYNEDKATIKEYFLQETNLPQTTKKDEEDLEIPTIPIIFNGEQKKIDTTKLANFINQALKEAIEQKSNTQQTEATIQGFEFLCSYINNKLFEDITIDNLIAELSDKIYNDYLYNSSKPKNTIWQKIDDELDKHGNNFKYKLTKPNRNLSSYSIAFEYKTDKDKEKIDFIKLSTGEAKIFTLLIYKYLIINPFNKQYKYLLLDEFDANLHPSLISFYIKTLTEIAKENKDIKILFTTHSAVTLKAIDNVNKTTEVKIKIYELKKDIDNTQHLLDEIDTSNLDNYIQSYSDGNFLTIEKTDKDKAKEAKYILFCEGKHDEYYLNKYIEKKYSTQAKNFFVYPVKGASHFKNVKSFLVHNLETQNKHNWILCDFDTAFDQAQRLWSGAPEDFFKPININKNNTLQLLFLPVIQEAEFNYNNISYPYTKNINEVIDNKKMGFEIEDLIVSYNIQLYKKFLDEKNASLDNFFTKQRPDKQKDSVQKFFDSKIDELNFAGFDAIFNIITNHKN